MSQEFQAPRGTLDWYGARAALRRAVLDAARDVFEAAGYSQVVTPTFEDTGVFARTSGEGSEVVRKEMYSFTDRSGRLAHAAAGGHGRRDAGLPRAR